MIISRNNITNPLINMVCVQWNNALLYKEHWNGTLSNANNKIYYFKYVYCSRNQRWWNTKTEKDVYFLFCCCCWCFLVRVHVYSHWMPFCKSDDNLIHFSKCFSLFSPNNFLLKLKEQERTPWIFHCHSIRLRWLSIIIIIIITWREEERRAISLMAIIL